jgi:DegV family protein with EDD domain
MPKIQIMADSTCDVPPELIEQYHILVIPNYVIWGTEEYLDRVTLRAEDFYRRLVTDPVKPTSAQATVQDFSKFFTKAVADGAEEIIVLTVSAAMSGDYQSAVNAAKTAPVPVHVVDAKGPTMTLGWQALAAARAVAEGLDSRAVLDRVDKVRQNLAQFVAMDTMEYLQRGGRLGSAVKWVGTMLNIKPLVQINHKTGLVEAVSIARTHKNLVEMLYQKFFEKMKPGARLHIAVLHGNVPEEAKALADRIREEYQPEELLINLTGPVLGINTGPRALALAGYWE